MFSGDDPSSTLATLKNLSALPEAIWELFLGVYCTALTSTRVHGVQVVKESDRFSFTTARRVR